MCTGHLFSERVAESEGSDQFTKYIEAILMIIKEKSLIYLKESTEWIFVPALEDPG